MGGSCVLAFIVIKILKMTYIDNYVDQTYKQYHGRPIQKRLRIVWCALTFFLSTLWISYLTNSEMRAKKCFVRFANDNYSMILREEDTLATDYDVSASFDYIMRSLSL